MPGLFLQPGDLVGNRLIETILQSAWRGKTLLLQLRSVRLSIVTLPAALPAPESPQSASPNLNAWPISNCSARIASLAGPPRPAAEQLVRELGLGGGRERRLLARAACPCPHRAGPSRPTGARAVEYSPPGRLTLRGNARQSHRWPPRSSSRRLRLCPAESKIRQTEPRERDLSHRRKISSFRLAKSSERHCRATWFSLKPILPNQTAAARAAFCASWSAETPLS